VNALTLLKNDHAEVKALVSQIEELGDRATASRKTLFQKIDHELTMHAEVEEKVFYPAFKERAEDSVEREEVLEAYEEHDIVKNLIRQLEDLDPKDESYRPKMQVLMGLVQQHIKAEESTMFKMARELFSKDELETLGEKLEAAKQQMPAAR
jgi:hemerythrin superfamily protein